MNKWCCYCQKSNHNDEECHSTRTMGWTCTRCYGDKSKCAGKPIFDSKATILRPSGPMANSVLADLLKRTKT